MIAGQFPNRDWRANPEGQTRSIVEAVAIAKRFCVPIPDDVAFFIDEYGDLGPDTMARGPRVTKPAGATVHRTDLVHDKTGKVPFRIRPDVLGSAEAIVAVLAHEMYEREALRPILQEGRVVIEDYIRHTRAGDPSNLHHQAWDVADAMVDRMRGEAK
jgi:hypothetical protein